MDPESTIPRMAVNKTPGIYPDVPYAHYESWTAANHSILRLFSRSAAHARQQILHPSAPTEAMDFGNALHRLVLQPEVFYREYAKTPGYGRRSNADKSSWIEWEKAHPGVQALDDFTWQALHQMRDQVMKHPAASVLLSERGVSEVSLAWLDQETKQPCKARIDRLTDAGGVPTILDLKTAKDASRREFERSIFNYGYHEQGAFYMDGAATLSPRERRFVMVAVEKEPPYAVAVYELEQLALRQGRASYQQHLLQYKECMESGTWPAYSNDIEIVSLPSWGFKNSEGM